MTKWIAVALCCAIPTLAQARDFSDPTWPCIQRKVPRLSIGVIWPQPIEDTELSAEAEALADKLALRRVSLEQAQEMIDAYSAADTNEYGAIFARVFGRLDNLRAQLITGIGDFSLSQVALSEQIETLRADMDTALGAADPNYDQIDALEETLDWSERIFKDRQSVVTYVCESPVLLEQRLFALGQMLLAKTQ